MTVLVRPGLDAQPLVGGACPTHNRILEWFAVPQLGAEVFALARAARDGATTRELALLFGIDESEALLLCLHHDVVPRRYPADGPSRELMRRTYLEMSLPPGDR